MGKAEKDSDAPDHPELSSARVAALFITTLLQDLLIIGNLALAIALFFVHVLFPTKLFFLFTALYAKLGRGYWALVAASEARADGWIVPPLLSAFASDVLWLLAVVLPAMLLFLLVRHVILRKQSIGGEIGDFALGELWAMIKAIGVGALFGALSVAFLMVMLVILGSPISKQPGVVVDPFASGIMMVDVLIVAFAVWAERKRTTDYNLAGRVVIAVLAASALLVTAQLMFRLETGFVVDDKPQTLAVYGFESSNVNDALTRKSAWPGAIHAFSFRARGKLRFAADALTGKSEKRWLRFFAHQPHNPFLASPAPLYSKRPLHAALDGRAVRVTYKLASWTKAPTLATHAIALAASGKGNRATSSRPLPRPRTRQSSAKPQALATTVSRKSEKLAIGVRWGISAEFTPQLEKDERRRLFVMVDGPTVYLFSETRAGKREHLFKTKLAKAVTRIFVKDESKLGGASVFADGRPLVHIDGKRRTGFTVVLRRPGGLQAGDRINLRADVTVAAPR